MNTIDPFAQQQYLSHETFRESGVGVQTPVWFVQDGDTIFMRTIANSGKVKRIRKNGQVKVAPSQLGDWLPATARQPAASLAQS